ncbi:TonB-dependent receptor [Acetobacteroides hydrogenigenes]|uniref:Outer membrane receptor protein involved in Fe transport n=1 Tax=Acetobacteroides hydrogenigenes TaxID=979970 RepID=A0A4R2EG91_9BACT|nr:TonB-dependent receptor [Acetobacteroides hydrogenigenes]TCN67563.1 outer membrane receptor protein involved in Fe transport [Acetobacteroides hydrogenigenes]
MRMLITLIISLFVSLSAMADISVIKGRIVDSKTKKAVAGVSVKISTGASTTSNSQGVFELGNVLPGSGVLSITGSQIVSKTMEVSVNQDQMVDLGDIPVQMVSAQDETAILLDETEVADDEGGAQNVSSLLASSDDVYFTNFGFKFGAMRFNLRGYDQDNFTTYINGINFNSTERGNFQYSSIGGLNDAVRNRDAGNGLEMTAYSYGNIGGASNIDLRPSHQAIGAKASIAFANRAYTTRAMATYSTGILKNGWAFTASGSQRWAKEGNIEGTYYNSWAYLFSAEKIFNSRHSISISTFGSPTERGTSAGSVQEAYDLAGDNLYNPNWGYQNGEKRNARIVVSFEPTVLLSYEWKISPLTTLNAGIAGRMSMYKKSGLNWYNANDPRPDYYRKLPSYETNPQTAQELANIWRTNKSIRQIDWDDLYEVNRSQGGDLRSIYIVEDQHNDFKELTFNATLNSKVNDNITMIGGVEARSYVGAHYKTINDLLGGKYWLDIDQFAERDFPDNPNMLQNNLNNPNRKVGVDDTFGFDYDLHSTSANGWIQGVMSYQKLELSAGVKYTFNSFYRNGNMMNGRAPQNSFGKGTTHTFNDISGKINALYKLTGKHFITLNALYETRSPLAYNAYVSPRIKDTRIPDMKNGKILSTDLGYIFNYGIVKGRVTGYYTQFNDQIEINNFYHDGYQTFVNYILTGVDKEHTGVEFGLSSKVTSQVTIEFLGNVGKYTYKNNPDGTTSYENGSKADTQQPVFYDGYKVSGQPQTALSLGVSYFHPKMWFFDTNVNYYDNSYIDLTPVRKEKSIMAKYDTQEKFSSNVVWDASIGKLIYFKNRTSLNINLSVQNILNNTDIKTGGFEQGRYDTDGNVSKFPGKYFYLQGVNFFLNIGYKF